MGFFESCTCRLAVLLGEGWENRFNASLNLDLLTSCWP
jgi:hypothetical protein